MGVEVSRRYLAAADLVLLCVEGDREVGEDEAMIVASRPTLVVRTKADLSAREHEHIAVSALTGEGIGELRRAAAERAFADRINLVDLEPSLTRERHRVALSRALVALADSLPHLVKGGDAVLAAHQIQQATNALDELLGAIDLEEVLDRVFSSFCVGK
jgi:tRNA modification GTPase